MENLLAKMGNAVLDWMVRVEESVLAWYDTLPRWFRFFWVKVGRYITFPIWGPPFILIALVIGVFLWTHNIIGDIMREWETFK